MRLWIHCKIHENLFLALDTIGQDYEFEDDEIEDFDERQGGVDWFYNYYSGDYGDYWTDGRGKLLKVFGDQIIISLHCLKPTHSQHNHILFWWSATCKDSYPKNYWKKCNTGCNKLKIRNACNKKWSAAIGNSNAGKRCKNQLSANHLKQKVKSWCKISCSQCGKSENVMFLFTTQNH